MHSAILPCTYEGPSHGTFSFARGAMDHFTVSTCIIAAGYFPTFAAACGHLRASLAELNRPLTLGTPQTIQIVVGEVDIV
jgi:hypothetical protein